ncbi:MAG: serine/threonine-protein kinase [Planctomycetota bacterium]
MNPDESRVEQLVRQAFERPSDQRSRFLDEECAGDEGLREKVEQGLKDRISLATISEFPLDVSPDTDPQTDRNLVVGIIALQMGLISQAALIRAMNAWLLSKSSPLEDILVDQGDLQPDTRELLTALIEKHVEHYGGSATKSLAALSSNDEVVDQLRSIKDPEVEKSVTVLSGQRSKEGGGSTLSITTGAQSDGRFRVLRQHRKGGLGEVSIALDQELNREVALKRVRPEYASYKSAQDRLKIEAEITGGLEHPNIVPVYGLGSHGDGNPFYCMRFIKGDSLKDAIQDFHYRKGQLTTSQRNLELRSLLRRFVDVCDAVGYAHSRQVLHRDLKPGNIMLGKYGETLVVDWGLAKAMAARDVSSELSEIPIVPRSGSTAAPTMPGSTVGTPGYMSPEQAEGKLDRLGPATDIYSLGATLYCLLTGQPPVDGDSTSEKLERARIGDIPPPRELDSSIPVPLEAICRKAMAVTSDDRYSATAKLSAEIERWLADEPIEAHRDGWGVRIARLLRKNQTIAATFTVASVVAFLGLAGITYVNAAKNRQIEARNARIGQKNEQLITTNRQLTESEEQLKLNEQNLLENIESFRGLTEAMITKAEREYSQTPGMGEFRNWFTEETVRVYEEFLGNRELIDEGVGSEASQLWYAQLLRILGNRKRASADLERALDLHQRSVAVLRKLLEENPESPMALGRCSQSLRDLAATQAQAGKLIDSIATEREATAISGEMLKTYPDSINTQRLHATNQLDLGGLLYERAEFPSAIESLGNAISLFRGIADSGKSNAQDEQLQVLAMLRQSACHRFEGQLVEAERLGREAIDVSRKRVAADPTRTFRHVLARSLLEMARIYSLQSKDNESVEKLIEAESIWEKLLEEFRDDLNYQCYAMEAKAEHGAALMKLNDRIAAFQKINASTSLARLFLTDEPPSLVAVRSSALTLTTVLSGTRKAHDNLNYQALETDAKQAIELACLLSPESRLLRRLLGQQAAK